MPNSLQSAFAWTLLCIFLNSPGQIGMPPFPLFCNLEQNPPPRSIQLLATAHKSQPPTHNNHPYDVNSTTVFIPNQSNPPSSPHWEIIAVMAAASDTGADKQIPAQFHQFVDLPAELKIKIIQEFIASLQEKRRSRPRMDGPLPFAPFAVIHSEWQHEIEAQQELFGSLCLSTDDLPAFRKMLNQHRSRFLSKVGLRVCIDDQVISFSGPPSAVVSRASNFIADSVATILENVEDATRAGFQTTKAKLELYTQIMTPYDLGYSSFSRGSSLPDGIDCDFSRLPLIHSTHKLSQRQYRFGKWLSLRHPKLLLLSPSSMLSLATRMPNLEEADVGISSADSIGTISGKPKFTHSKCGSDMDLSRNWL